MKLTDRTIRGWVKDAPSGSKIWDGEGLYLHKGKLADASWRIKYRWDNKEKTYTIGPLSLVSLAKARSTLAEVKLSLLEGRDPNIKRLENRANQSLAAGNTFESIARAWLAHRRTEWSPVHFEKSERALERDIFPTLGSLPITSIKPPMIALAINRVMQRDAVETAGRILFHVRSIFRYARAIGVCDDNPADPVQELLPKKRKHGRMKALLQSKGLWDILRRAAQANLSRPIFLAHLLTAYTAARITNIVEARWQDMDLDGDQPIWTIPREQMKTTSRDHHHRIPLCGEIVVQLKAWRAVVGPTTYCFPSPQKRKGHITREGVEKAYRETMGLSGQHSPHGWRSALSTLGREAGFEREVVELALDHAHDNDVAMAYDRGERFEKRIELYRWWAKLLEGEG
ncbi:DUF4102 domain-containing protein [Massilia arenosa]|uniref:DUF4102 domain-containing protein n=1 Tax=Zemynaea arenosa TaxID=2561931 RepID=A0A4Y9S684_9BURK|nr:integrase arm-type DNA-binding domain-containing protein [Massilia arenosa]TFW16897.1 DUF4102 domain-containing protein [Massilia arenosa]